MPISSVVLAGLRFSITLPDRGSTHSPLMKFLKDFGAADVAMRIPPVVRAANSAVKCCVLAELIRCRSNFLRFRVAAGGEIRNSNFGGFVLGGALILA